SSLSFPQFEDVLELVAELIIQCSHLLTEIAYKTATLKLVSAHPVTGLVNKGTQPGQRAFLSVGEYTLQFLAEVNGVSVNDCQLILLLAAEIVVEGALRHAPLAKHLFDAHSLESTLGTEFNAGSDKPVAGSCSCRFLDCSRHGC